MIKQMGFSNHVQYLRKWKMHYALFQTGSDFLKGIFEGHGENGCLSWIRIFPNPGSRIQGPKKHWFPDPDPQLSIVIQGSVKRWQC